MTINQLKVSNWDVILEILNVNGMYITFTEKLTNLYNIIQYVLLTVGQTTHEWSTLTNRHAGKEYYCTNSFCKRSIAHKPKIYNIHDVRVHRHAF